MSLFILLVRIIFSSYEKNLSEIFQTEDYRQFKALKITKKFEKLKLIETKVFIFKILVLILQKVFLNTSEQNIHVFSNILGGKKYWFL